MARFDFDISDFMRRTDLMKVAAVAAARTAVEDSIDDLERIATNIAPIDTGALRRSANKRVTASPLRVVGEVSFSAVENSPRYGRFNYALWTHEASYSLGPRSAASPGTDGYSVGNKYLSRPLHGEAPKYFMWWATAIRGALGRF